MKSVTRRILACMWGIGGLGILGYLALMGNEMALGAVIVQTAAIIAFYFGVTKTNGTS